MAATRVDITQRAALVQLLAHLRTALTLNDRQCFACVNPLGVEIPSTVGGNRFVSVSLRDGQFPFEETVEHQCYEASEVVVTGYVRIAFDNVAREEEFLLNAERGVLAFKEDLIRVLCGVDIDDANGQKFLREWMSPRRATAPDYDHAKKIGWVQLIIPLEFDWDLTA